MSRWSTVWCVHPVALCLVRGGLGVCVSRRNGVFDGASGAHPVPAPRLGFGDDLGPLGVADWHALKTLRDARAQQRALALLAAAVGEQGSTLLAMTRAPWLNLGSGEHRAPGPWINLDVHYERARGFCPDLLVDPADPFGAIIAPAARIYVGHMLEHTPWSTVPRVLAQVHDALAPGGEVLVTGPDVFRSIRLWRADELPWDMLTLILEHADLGTPEWPQESHWWNCHEDRLTRVMAAVGFSTRPIADPSLTMPDWPVVGWASWQCAVRGVKKTRRNPLPWTRRPRGGG